MTPSAPRRRVILHSGEDDLLSAAHDRASRNGQADRIAALLTEPAEAHKPYVVPSDTLSLETAATIGIERAEDFFGGAVPLPFVGTKAVSHGLAFRGAKAPTGWNPDLGEALAEVTLAGFTAFSVADAREAGFRLLASGPVRLKDVHAVAGLGQTTVSTPAELISALTARDPEAIARHGLVLEENLMDHETLSVGSVQVGHRRVAYWGFFCLTALTEAQPLLILSGLGRSGRSRLQPTQHARNNSEEIGRQEAGGPDGLRQLLPGDGMEPNAPEGGCGRGPAPGEQTTDDARQNIARAGGGESGDATDMSPQAA